MYRNKSRRASDVILVLLLCLQLAACGDENGATAPANSVSRVDEAGSTPGKTAEQLFSTQCASCHGDRAQGNEAMQAPALAGQLENYLLTQLDNFAAGVRGSDPRDVAGKTMQPFAASLGAPEKKQVASWLARLPASRALQGKADPEQFARGKKVYQARCASCHGYAATGNAALNAASLLGLSQAYLQRQFNYYLEGVRGAADGDRYGRQMRAIAGTLKDPQDIAAVSYYLAALP